LLDGLTTALTDGGPNRDELARLLGSLTQRVFLMRNVHDDAPVLLKSRWALSYLRGPLTTTEISRLMAPRKTAAQSAPAQVLARDALPQAAAAATAPATGSRPPLPTEVEERFVPVRGAADRITYQPRALGVAKLHFVDKPLGVDEWVTLGLSAPLADDGRAALWEEAEACAPATTTGEAVPGATFGELPAAAQRAANFVQWGKDLSTHLYQNQKLQLFACDALKLLSKSGESEGDFRSRIQLAAREQRDTQAAKLREKFAPKVTQLNGQLQRAREKAERERGQLSQQKFQTAISVGATILGALMGRKTISAGSIGRATTAARSASRIGRESQDVNRAEESAEQIEQRLADLNRECETAVAALDTTLDAQAVTLRAVSLAPRKTDIAVGKVLLLWTPWRTGADGFPASVG
jgi:hypothetical protein